MRGRAEAGGETLFFVIRSTDRRRPSTFFRPDEVPEFEGDSAWFEMLRVKGGWRIVRRVRPDGSPFEA